MTRSDEETELDLGPTLRERQERTRRAGQPRPDCPRADAHRQGPREADLSPAGFKGGQGRSAQEVEDNAAGALLYIAILAAAILGLYIVHRLGAF